MSWRASWTSARSSTSRMRSASSGVSDANRSASTTSVGVGTGRLPIRYRGLAFDDDLAEELRLLRLDPTQADQLEHREKRHDDLGAPSITRRERREKQRPGVAENRENHRHPLEHRRRVRLDLARSLPPLVLDQPSQCPLEQVHAEILERHLLGRRQRATRTAPDQALLGLPRGEPLAPRLDPRVLAKARLELEAQRQTILVELLILHLVGWHQELRFEVDQRRGDDQIRAGRFEVPEFHRLEVSEVLVGDGAHREGRQIDLVRAAEVQKQVEGALEAPHAKREVTRGGENVRFVDTHGVRRTAARTSAIVAWATLRARREPSCRISTILAGFSAKPSRRPRTRASGGGKCFGRPALPSGHPTPPGPPPGAGPPPP